MIDIIKLHEAIRKLNSEVITIVGDTAYDANGNEVTYDKTAAETEANKDSQ